MGVRAERYVAGMILFSNLQYPTWYISPTSPRTPANATWTSWPSAPLTRWLLCAPLGQVWVSDCLGSALNELGLLMFTCLPITDGRDIDLVTLGSGPLKIWAIARQHPGEPMAEWWVEGYLHRLLDGNDAVSRKLLTDATFYVVPNMNPGKEWRDRAWKMFAACRKSDMQVVSYSSSDMISRRLHQGSPPHQCFWG